MAVIASVDDALRLGCSAIGFTIYPGSDDQYEMMEELNAVYDDTALAYEQKVSQRGGVFERSLARFDADVAPTFESVTFSGFRNTPLNNATLLTRIRYYHRLPDFAALLDARGGDLAAVLEELKSNAGTVEDPFEMLPGGGD